MVYAYGMSERSRQQGFGVIEILLLIGIVGLIGFVGWYVWDSNQRANQSYNSADISSVLSTSKKAGSASSKSVSADVYAGWKTFCSSVIKGCFKYDPNWIFAQCAPVEINAHPYFQDCATIEDVQLISPSKTASINWYLMDSIDPTVKQCVNDPSKVSYSGIEQVPNIDNLYYVNIKDEQNIQGGYLSRLTLRNGNNGQVPTPSYPAAICPGFDYFLTSDGKYVVSFGLNYLVNDKQQFNTNLPSQTDLQTVKKTLLSFYYK